MVRKKMEMYELLKKIYPLRMAPVSEDMDEVASILCEELPFSIHKYKSGLEFNGWIIPQKWKPIKAIISYKSKIIYNGMKHPLRVIGYSTSFKGKIPLEKLKEHLFYHPSLPDSLVYHCDYFYKQWKRDWGFSVSKTFFDSLKEGEYKVILETTFEEGAMMVLDYLLSGQKSDIIILNAHNCHAGQANDDISGVVVAIETIKRLAEKKNLKYSYKIVIAPEHLGTVFYLANQDKKTIKAFKYAIFLEMLGNENRFALQESFTGKSLLDKAAHHYFKHHWPEYYGAQFRKIIGNDETVWEAPGYEVPCISISRWPYQEYHSDKDDEKIISKGRLEESVQAVLGILEILEKDTTLKRQFDGLIALSNPKYDLYISTVDPSIRKNVSEEQKNWKYLMDCIVRYFDQNITILDIALKHKLDFFEIYDYLKKFEEKGLISFIPN